MARNLRTTACVLLSWGLLLGVGMGMSAAQQTEPGQPTAAEAHAEYARKLAVYQAARQAFEEVAGPYWDEIRLKRQQRNAKRRNGEVVVAEDYVLTQPPRYTGPPRPVPPPDEQQEEARQRAHIPVVADFLHQAREHYQFTPARPAKEIDYKRAYAKMARAAGLTPEQAARVYIFEVGGNGKYNTQAGLEGHAPGAHAISTALGYNQLLTTNSVSIMAEQGERFASLLKAKAAGLSDAAAKSKLLRKADTVLRMTAYCRTVPGQWSEHEKLAKTPKGLAVHAMVLDVDVGPLLQTQKLLDSIVFARRKGYAAPLTAAELEMMNLTGDGNGFDMITIPAAMREHIPTSNFFQRGGYERNAVAIRNNTVARLLAATDARMDKGMDQPGAKDLLAAFKPNEIKGIAESTPPRQ
jgi:hypothetical protein